MIKKRTHQFNKYKTLLLGDKDYKELLHGTGISAIFTFGGMVLGYAVAVLSARWFGAEGVGLMAMISTIIVFGGAMGGLGMQGSVVRFINQWKAEKSGGKIRALHIYILQTILPFSLLISLIIYLARFWLIDHVFHEPRLLVAINWLAILFPFIVLSTIGLEIIKGYKKLIPYHMINKIIRNFGKLMIIAIIYYGGKSVYGPTIGLLGGFIIAFVLVAPLIWKYFQTHPKRESISKKEILKTSIPMMITSISLVIMNQTDIVMLGMFTNTSEVGIYQTAYKVAELIPYGLIMVDMIIGQKIAQLYYSGEKHKLQNIMKIGTTIATIIGVSFTIIFSVGSTFIMGVFGSAFVAGSNLLIILCLGQLINASAGPVVIYLNMTGRQYIIQNTLIVTAVMNIGLNLFLIPQYGSEGAALASAFCLITWNGYLVWRIWKQDRVWGLIL